MQGLDEEYHFPNDPVFLRVQLKVMYPKMDPFRSKRSIVYALAVATIGALAVGVLQEFIVQI